MARRERNPAPHGRAEDRGRGLPRARNGFPALRWTALRPANDNRPPPALLPAGAAALVPAAAALIYGALRWMF